MAKMKSQVKLALSELSRAQLIALGIQLKAFKSVTDAATKSTAALIEAVAPFAKNIEEPDATE